MEININCKDCKYYKDSLDKYLPEIYKRAIVSDEAKIFTGYCFLHRTFVFFEWCCGKGVTK